MREAPEERRNEDKSGQPAGVKGTEHPDPPAPSVCSSLQGTEVFEDTPRKRGTC